MKTRDVSGMTDFELEVPPTPHFPGRILREYPLIQRPNRAAGTRSSDSDLIDLVSKKFAMDGKAPSQDDAFFFPAEISNQNLDSYFTKMAESSLRNYAEDCQAGVAFQNSHQNYSLGVGYVIDGEYVESDTDPSVLADIYTVRGLKLNSELGTDDFIRGVETGLIRDVSIGFKPGEGYSETCNICRNEYWSYDCWHCAGVTYELPDDPNLDPTDDAPRMVTCIVWIENARLSEVSAVYDGSTPDAMILSKATREMRAGRMTSAIRSQIERRFHIDLRDPQKTFGGIKSGTDQERQIPEIEEENISMTELELAQQRATDAEAKLRTAETEREAFKLEADKIPALEQRATTAETRITELETVIRESAADIEGVEVTDESKPEDVSRAVAVKAKSLTKRAAEAEEYREDAIAKTLQSGVRAFGDDFDQDKKRSFLEKLDLSEIVDQGNDWEARATGKFPKGRISSDDPNPDLDEDGEGGTRSVNPEIPTSAYAGI